jgi:hypothetical protein
MQRPIFRKVAVKRLSSPEQLDQLMQITTPMGWLALIALGGMLVLALLWGIFGSIPVRLTGNGILIRRGGVNAIAAPMSGQLTRLLVTTGDSVTTGQLVAEITASGATSVTQIFSAYAGRVVEIAVSQGALVDRGTRLVSIVDDAADLEAVIYLSSTDGKKVRKDMEVQISPSTVAQEEFGSMKGVVASVGEYPLSYEAMLSVLQNDDLVKSLRAGGAPIEVRVQLKRADTFSGYEWSSPNGPQLTIENGTLCEATVTVGERQPLGLVLPFLQQ